MECQGVVIVVQSGSIFNEREFREMILHQLNKESGCPIPVDISVVEMPISPDILLESFEEYEEKEAIFFKKSSYQQQQKELRFLNKRRKK